MVYSKQLILLCLGVMSLVRSDGEPKEFNVLTTFGKEYYINVGFGLDKDFTDEHRQDIYMALDIQSDDSWVAQDMKLCPTCDFKQRYDFTKDKLEVCDTTPATGLCTVPGGTISPDTYTLSGFKCYTQVDFYPNTLLDKLDFCTLKSATMAWPLLEASGALAMGLKSYTDSSTHNFVYAMKAGGLLPEHNSLVAFHFDYFSGGNIRLGGMDNSIVPPGTTLVWEESHSTDRWALSALSATYGNGHSIFGAAREIIIDTRVPYLALPATIYQQFIGDFPCEPTKCLFDIPRYEDFPTITITLTSGNILTVEPEDYLTFSPTIDGKYAVEHMLVSKQTDALYGLVIGTNILRHYYLILDYDGAKMCFWKLGKDDYESEANYVLIPKNSMIIIGAAAIAFVLFILILLLSLCLCCRTVAPTTQNIKYIHLPSTHAFQ